MSNGTARSRRRAGVSGLDLIEEAVGLLRVTPLAGHLTYHIGAVPFWIALLYFISDMSRSAYAMDHLADASLGVALLYIWNKCWQAAFAARLRSIAEGRPDEPWTRARILRMIAAQASLQSWGLIIRPIALIITVPFVWISNFYQCVTVLGDGSETKQSVAGRAWAQAKLWPGQAHSLVSSIYLFTIFVWANVAMVLGFAPTLLKMLFAVDTTFSRGSAFYLNSTFLTATVALTSLAVDPLRKAVYVIRCFRGAALESGDDLSADLARVRARSGLPPLIAATLLFFLPIPCGAETPVEAPKSADAAELDHRISEVLTRREFAWREPRDGKQSPRGDSSVTKSWIDNVWKSIDRWTSAAGRNFGKLVRWVKSVFTFNPPAISPPTAPGGFDWLGLGKALLVIFVAALAVLFGWLLVRFFQQRKPKTVLGVATTLPIPDLRSEEVVASQLPEDGWIALAREHASRGELSLALRAAWLAGLAHLGQRELIVILRHKTNRDYLRELRRRARDRAPLLSAFDQNLSSFERSWYGKHEVTEERFDEFEENLDQIRRS